MKDKYLYYYILTFFNTEKITTISQILHVFHAKRTPSMFYLIEMNEWHHGFSLFKKMTRDHLTKIIENLRKQGFIKIEGKGYILTEKGFKACKNYFEDHYFPKNIKSFTNANVRIPFWNRFQLFTQVFSEYSYKNAQYIPIVKHPHHQENVRLLFQRFDSNREQLLRQWVLEQIFLFKHLEEQAANVLINQLTGHQKIGKTRDQISEFYEMSSREFSFFLFDSIEECINLIHLHKNKLPIHCAIIEILHEETNWGLSASTFVSYQMLKNRASLSQIAHQRSIKENTVKEHILEIAFTFKHFPYKRFVPEDIYQYLNQQFNEVEDFSYKEAISKNESIEFMHYRLVELERMRSK